MHSAAQCDNAMEFKFNGETIFTSRDWPTPSVATVTVRPGLNEITVCVANWLPTDTPYGAGGFVAAMWRASDSQPLLVTDDGWQFSPVPVPSPTDSGPVALIGRYGVSPWGTREALRRWSGAEMWWIWASGDEYFQPNVTGNDIGLASATPITLFRQFENSTGTPFPAQMVTAVSLCFKTIPLVVRHPGVPSCPM